MDDLYAVERSISIATPASEIFPHVIDFHRWPGWSPWEDVDPDMVRRYSGADSGVGAVYEWSGNRKAGEGRMEITEVDDGALVSIALDFLKPFKSSSTTTMLLTEDEGRTRVTWRMTGPKTFMTRMMGLFKSMDALVGPDFEKGLAQLKTLAEG